MGSLENCLTISRQTWIIRMFLLHLLCQPVGLWGEYPSNVYGAGALCVSCCQGQCHHRPRRPHRPFSKHFGALDTESLRQVMYWVPQFDQPSKLICPSGSSCSSYPVRLDSLQLEACYLLSVAFCFFYPEDHKVQPSAEWMQSKWCFISANISLYLYFLSCPHPDPSTASISECCSSHPLKCCHCHTAPLNHMMGKVYSFHHDFWNGGTNFEMIYVGAQSYLPWPLQLPWEHASAF